MTCGNGLKAAIVSGTVVPIFATAADSEIGVDQFMDAVVDLLPAPSDEFPEGVKENTPANLIFKTSADPFVGKVSYLRILWRAVDAQHPTRNWCQG